MRPLSLLLIFFVLSSCHYLEKKKVDSEDLLNEELQTFNWNDVDTYPTFDGCDSITDKAQSQMCFQQTMLSSVSSYLQSQNIIVSEDVNDTVVMRLEIDKSGSLRVQGIDMNSQTKLQIPELDSLLRESLKGIPKLYPAIKRNQQVTTVFELPVIVKIE
ncbi:hypothetical protein J4050_02595 [Winogradskyella sp. DF17]|uniref:TonB C-terminal domain-containing protein n=1 Tax=Winogradskyella pelagia TaxID=2819984 RepID=A0ABS3T160_9FLAO|nr:hypothetical protein [Winogradskyella sp. DF17]MBO3115616.1 hypothetical protein [Winogradskyella sp. DF17]